MVKSCKTFSLILVIQFILPLFECGAVNLYGYREISCIEVTSFHATDKAQETIPICNFIRKDDVAQMRVLFVSDGAVINQHTDRLKRIINEHCYFEILNLDSESLLQVGRRWMESVDAIILDPILCRNLKTNSEMLELIETFRDRAFVLGISVDGYKFEAWSLRRNHRWNQKFGIQMIGAQNDEEILCKASNDDCFGEPNRTASSLNITARRFEPFTIADNGTTLNRGIEIMLIESIAQKLNLQVHYNAYGVGNLSHQGMESEFIIGGWPIGHEYGHAISHHPSVAYDYDSTVWCVRHARLIPTWQNIMKIFKELTPLLLIFVFYYVSVVVIYFAAISEDADYDAYHIMLIAISVGVNMAPPNLFVQKSASRIAATLLLLFAMLQYIYMVSFYVVVINTVYFQAQVDSWDEIRMENFELAIDEQRADQLRNGEFSPEIVDRFTICPDIDECLARLTHNDHLAVAVSRKHALNNPVIPNWEIHCFEDPQHFYGYPVSMFIPRNHPLESKINERIQWALEGGLLKKWAADSQIKFKRPIGQHIGPVVLTNDHIFLAWFFYFLAGSFATGAFIAEHIVHRMMRRQNPGRFWQIADMLIDGERHFLLPPSGQRRVMLRRAREYAARRELLFGSLVSFREAVESVAASFEDTEI